MNYTVFVGRSMPTPPKRRTSGRVPRTPERYRESPPRDSEAKKPRVSAGMDITAGQTVVRALELSHGRTCLYVYMCINIMYLYLYAYEYILYTLIYSLHSSCSVVVAMMRQYGFHDLLNGRFQLSKLPPGVLYVCVGKPHRCICYTCSNDGPCDLSEWDSYKVEPEVALNGVPKADGGTISGLAGDLNRIVLEYLGRFCIGTHKRYINSGDLKNFCNYCDKWGHEFDLGKCQVNIEEYIAAQHSAAREARDAERRAWRQEELYGRVIN